MDNNIPQESLEFDISKDDQKYIKRVCNNDRLNVSEKLEALINHYSEKEETILNWIDFLNLSLSSQFIEAKEKTLKNKKRYIISSAQNGSSVNEEFLNNIKAYAKFIDAEIGIIATRYRNPTSIWKETGDVWDHKVHEFLTAKRQKLHKYVALIADLKIQATSPNPTNGIELIEGEASCIIGSPRVEMRSVAVLPSQKQKFLYSTGSVTVPNFTDSVAGGKAAEHHTFGFLVVEIENDEVAHIRNVSADSSGSFNDLIFRVHKGVITQEDTECLVWGDCHFAKESKKVTSAFRSLCFDLGVSVSVLHDVWDSESINTHNLKNPIIKYQLMKEGRDNLKAELANMTKNLEWFENNMDETIVVASNHDDMLDRAMVLSDWRDNLNNAEIFLKFLKLSLSGKAKEGLIPYCINKKFKKVRALGLNDSYILNGVELALHGHKGPNGRRGDITGFSKLNFKTIIGHSHSPSIRWGCYQVGVSCKLDHEYNKGLSGWAYAGVTLNKHGKRQMIILNKDTLTYTTLLWLKLKQV